MKSLIAFPILFASVAMAAPSNAELEVLQTQATLQYHSKQFKDCSSTLKKLLAIDPKNTNAMELEALALRRMNKDDEAAKIYDTLIKTAPKEKRPAYSFELATIEYAQKKTKLARKHFQIAAENNFNTGTSSFYLGVMAVNAKSWINARGYLTAALTNSDAAPLKVISQYYLATTYAQLGKSEAAIRNYYAISQETSESAKSNPTAGGPGTDAMTGDIRKNALKQLSALDRGGPYASLTLMNQFDTNVQANPSEVPSPVGFSSQASMKTIFSGAVGYTTSPIKNIQLTPSYSLYTNYDYNEPTRTYNFVTQTASLYALYKPFARLSAGLKGSGSFSMQNLALDDGTIKQLNYHPYSLSGDIGPVARYELTARISIAGEVSWRPKKFYLDPSSGDTRRSGNGAFSRLTADFISDYWWMNPLVYLSFEWDNPVGKTYRFNAFGGGLANTVQFTDKLSFTTSIDISSTDYYTTLNPERIDVYVSPRLAANYIVDAHWSIIGDISYINNESSTPASFKYNRTLTSLGASYNF